MPTGIWWILLRGDRLLEVAFEQTTGSCFCICMRRMLASSPRSGMAWNGGRSGPECPTLVAQRGIWIAGHGRPAAITRCSHRNIRATL